MALSGAHRLFIVKVKQLQGLLWCKAIDLCECLIFDWLGFPLSGCDWKRHEQVFLILRGPT